MKKTLTYLFVVSLLSSCSNAQQQSFDITSYTSPKDWKKQTADGGLQFSTEDAKGNFCVITLFRSIRGTNDPKTNFDAAWEDLVKGTVKTNAAPEMQPSSSEDGWEVRAGYAPFESDDTKGVALLTTTSGYGKMVNILILTNSDVYEKEMTAFLESVSFKKPTGGNNDNRTARNEPAAKKDGYTYSTVSFDDGWKSSIQNDWVLVEKGDLKIYLFYALPYNGSDFSGTGLVPRDYYWDNYVTKYFNVQTKQYQDNGEVMGSFKPKYVEGWASDKQSGERLFIAMTLSIAPNTAYLCVATAPDEGSIRRQFPKANDKYSSDLADMNRYNRFPITANDISGKWQDGNTSTMQWYYEQPGGYESYAGMTVAATENTFIFNSNNTYTSIHNGATGSVGSIRGFRQEYKGRTNVGNWNLTATNRWQNKTEQFEAWFEVVRGGRILHLKTPGNDFALCKIN